MKEALKQMSGGGNRDQGKSPGWSAGGPVKGGEMLAIIDERLQRTSGYDSVPMLPPLRYS